MDKKRLILVSYKHFIENLPYERSVIMQNSGEIQECLLLKRISTWLRKNEEHKRVKIELCGLMVLDEKSSIIETKQTYTD